MSSSTERNELYLQLTELAENAQFDELLQEIEKTTQIIPVGWYDDMMLKAIQQRKEEEAIWILENLSCPESAIAEMLFTEACIRGLLQVIQNFAVNGLSLKHPTAFPGRTKETLIDAMITLSPSQEITDYLMFVKVYQSADLPDYKINQAYNCHSAKTGILLNILTTEAELDAVMQATKFDDFLPREKPVSI
jgi:hypothetical protein